MQIHKKDIVWPEAGVVRKRGREWRQRERKERRKQSHWLSLFAVSFSVLFSGKYKNYKEGQGKCFFLKQNLEFLPSQTIWRNATAFN